MLVMVGMPGSGKSTFSEQLVASGRGWARVCQDECGGSRRACEGEWSRLALRDAHRGARPILDRCNATAADRREWMDLALLSKRDKGIWAVFFDVAPDECAARVAARTNHPTIPQGRGAKAVESFAKLMQPPTREEGFERVITVRSYEEANALLTSLGAAPPDLPTTPALQLAAAAAASRVHKYDDWDAWEPKEEAQGDAE
uniref:Uncharacterized protein n=1 Tax=Chlamydomonas leiostraca TaxID=1034604 RepID=A0A7S0RF48_9CHLO|mmetsp:Transcript_20545/g.52161  ORF Transcript_20545/g.52161 Transcript_20545/m.52161 type:complete len:201 (+) Transcript_20545:151-753(+)